MDLESEAGFWGKALTLPPTSSNLLKMASNLAAVHPHHPHHPHPRVLMRAQWLCSWDCQLQRPLGWWLAVPVGNQNLARPPGLPVTAQRVPCTAVSDSGPYVASWEKDAGPGWCTQAMTPVPKSLTNSLDQTLFSPERAGFESFQIAAWNDSSTLEHVGISSFRGEPFLGPVPWTGATFEKRPNRPTGCAR